ncbi:MAG: hypothetical protein M3O35_00995 [Acidobacteriota bacterium]|nr:hypothetical protein [Acidobacteriota bacterium]
MIEPNALAGLIAQARRRKLGHLAMHEFALAACIALGGGIVLLLAGTQLLDWYWPVLLFAVALVAAVWRVRTRIPSGYGIARTLDEKLALQDSLSTAFYFEENPERVRVSQDTVDRQRTAAEDLARTADLRRAVPFQFPRALYAAAGLLFAAAGLFAVRYGVTHSLNLGPSLAAIAFEGVATSDKDAREARKKGLGERAANDRWKEQMGLTPDPWQSTPLDQSAAPDGALNTVDTPDVNNEHAANSGAKSNGNPSQDPQQDPNESADDGQNSAGKDSGADDEAGAPNQDGGVTGQDPKKDGQRDGKASDKSGLTDKIKDALASLMSKLKMQPKPGGSQTAASRDGGSQASKQRDGKDAKGTPQQGKPSDNAQASSESNSDAQAQANQQAQASQGKSNSPSPEHAASPDSKSGIGKQDGDKALKDAQQLAAMGKISEIIGKRSSNVTGEMMVEVASGKQQLKTQYSQKRSSHAEAGGEINRDEIPLAYQQYVQQYFEEIRKLAPAESKSKPDQPRKTPGS